MTDLLQPSLQEETPVATWLPAPFRLYSLLYVAFFGGPLAAAAIGVLQARRLRQSPHRLGRVVALGMVAALGVGLTAVLLDNVAAFDAVETDLLFRRANNLWGLLTWMALSRMLTGPDRRYTVRHLELQEPRSSLWVPGLLAVFLVGSAQQLLLRLAALPFLPEAGVLP